MTLFVLIGILILISISVLQLLWNRKIVRQLEKTAIENEVPTNSGNEPDHLSESSSEGNETPDSRENSNREALYNIFTKMGCNPGINEDQHLSFSYQGENFLIMFNGAFIRIWDLSWHSIKTTDDSYTLMKDATNYANFSFGPTIVLHSPDETGNIILSSRMDIPFIGNMRDGRGYITAILDSFFALKNNLHREITRLKDDPHDRTLHDNPIGFDTASLSDPTSPQAN